MLSKQFKGGYRVYDLSGSKELQEYKALLDSKAWQAVGRTEGWKENVDGEYEEGEWQLPSFVGGVGNHYGAYFSGDEWQYRIHQMIDHLIQGGTVESFIETL